MWINFIHSQILGFGSPLWRSGSKHCTSSILPAVLSNKSPAFCAPSFCLSCYGMAHKAGHIAVAINQNRRVGPLVHWFRALASVPKNPPQGCEFESCRRLHFGQWYQIHVRILEAILFKLATQTGTSLETYQEDKVGRDNS